jgi:hypothetical protein
MRAGVRGRLVKGVVLVGAALAGALALSACAPGVNDVASTGAGQEAGFWLGLWHGIICPVTFVVSLFTDNVNMYEVHNSGNWYDAGFVLGVLIILGGPSRSIAAGSARGATKRGHA